MLTIEPGSHFEYDPASDSFQRVGGVQTLRQHEDETGAAFENRIRAVSRQLYDQGATAVRLFFGERFERCTIQGVFPGQVTVLPCNEAAPRRRHQRGGKRAA